MRTLFAVTVIAALAWVPVPAGADSPPSLAEIAARNKDKKKGKPITDDDLRSPRRGGTVSAPNGEAGSITASPAPGEKKEGEAAKPGAPKAKTEDELREEAQTAWREKLTQAQADVTNWQAEINRLQALMDDRAAPMYGSGRAARADLLETAKRNLATAQQQVADLQEEGRQKRYR
jgi:hypothetical protein